MIRAAQFLGFRRWRDLGFRFQAEIEEIMDASEARGYWWRPTARGWEPCRVYAAPGRPTC